MPETHILSTLTKKRAELLGLIDYHKKEIKKINENLSHINASIKIFNPDFDLREVKSKQFKQPCKYFKRGERNLLVLEILRDSDNPLTTEEIADKIKSIKQIEDDIQQTIYNSLKTYYKNGVIEKAKISLGVYGWQIKQVEEQSNLKLL